jgi:hypothetical protein
MIIGSIETGQGSDVALQICSVDSYCYERRSLTPNPTKTRLGFCSWCWGKVDNNE